jgi:hypothetical protein
MVDEHSPKSHANTNYLPVETDIEMGSDPPPPPHSKTSTWRYNPKQYFDCNTALTILTQQHILQVRAFRRALRCDSSRSHGLFGLS